VPVKVVYNGIDLGDWSQEGTTTNLDALSGLTAPTKPTVRVGLVATMARWKGHDVFLHALALLPVDLPIRGYVIGGAIYSTDGSQRTIEELGVLASSLGIAEKVGFTGFLENPAAAMRSLDICVHASTQPEPFGRVIVEAMAVGLPVIASRGGGADELIEEGKTALAFPPGDAKELAGLIKRLANDKLLRRRMGDAGHSSVESRFGRDPMVRSIISSYVAATGGN
jgi:glycosyltransferase involved in cell wall biosynthesis